MGGRKEANAPQLIERLPDVMVERWVEKPLPPLVRQDPDWLLRSAASGPTALRKRGVRSWRE